MLEPGLHVGQQLAGMVQLGQAIDHRHPRMLRQLLLVRLRVVADHDGVAHPRQHLGGVGQRLFAPQLGLRRGQHQRMAAELGHADFEGHAGAGRALGENHRQGAAEQGTMLGQRGFQLDRAGHDAPGFIRPEIAEFEEMPYSHVLKPQSGHPAQATRHPCLELVDIPVQTTRHPCLDC